MRNRHLDTTDICPKKIAIDGIIRYHLETDPPEEDIPPPLLSFGTHDYRSNRDEDFACYDGEIGPSDIPVPLLRWFVTMSGLRILREPLMRIRSLGAFNV